MYYKTGPLERAITIDSCSRMIKQLFSVNWLNFAMQHKPCRAHPHHQLNLLIFVLGPFTATISQCRADREASTLPFAHLTTEMASSCMSLKPNRTAISCLKKSRVSVIKLQNSKSNVVLAGDQAVSFRTEPEIVLPEVQHRRDYTVCPVILPEVFQSNFYPEHTQK